MRKRCKVRIKYRNTDNNIKEEIFTLYHESFLNKDNTIEMDIEMNYIWLSDNPQIEYKILSINGSNGC